ncbi:hypothetical protein F4811DRAFT_558962 [Daldinia bambusicola]|nr:hypothetical protein F4811DRAFT_558962 [Daldinia bambusicola]
MASNNAFFGLLDVSLGIITIPCLPTIVAEWVALIPLAIHLASYQDDYITTGNISLLGRLPASLFPALGTFSNLVRFLEQGAGYLDYASMKGGFSQKAWDVNWGSAFPVANGAASASIISFLTKKRRPATVKIDALANPSPSSPASSVRSTQEAEKASNIKYRPQVLNIYNFDRVDERRRKHQPLRYMLSQIRALRLFQALQVLVLIGLCVFCIISGAFGTAAVVLIRVISEIFIHSVTVQRPVGYLKNNETHDACMLVAAHENAMEWHLYIGDRGIVDTLLNKPMIVPPEGRMARVAAFWFRCAHGGQLIAMTFVAAQKGWDGVCLIILLAAHYVFCWLCGRDALVSNWMEREGIEAKVGSFELSGRHAVMGAVQILSGTKIDHWMDSIIIPHPRRDFWLESLMLPENKSAPCPKELNEFDEQRVKRDVVMAKEAVRLIKQHMLGLTAV